MSQCVQTAAQTWQRALRPARLRAERPDSLLRRMPAVCGPVDTLTAGTVMPDQHGDAKHPSRACVLASSDRGALGRSTFRDTSCLETALRSDSKSMLTQLVA